MAKKSGIDEILKASEAKKKKASAGKVKVAVEKWRLKREKSVNKTFTEDPLFFETDTVVFRLKQGDGYKDIVRKYPDVMKFNKAKVGSKTKVATGEWTRIVDVVTSERNLVFVIEPLETN